jgi:hypothetical protein
VTYLVLGIHVKQEVSVTGMVACNPSTEACGSQIQSQPELHSKFEASLGYIAKPYLKTKKKKYLLT